MARRLSTWLWILAILGLLALRIPAWAAPVGSDQYLYLYVADRLLEGGVPYVDAWDQKPPAVFFLYALLRAVWPYASVVALADLLSAAVLAWALVTLGRQTIGTHAGWAAAALALVFGHPSFSRLSGVYVRGQCEAFIAPAVTCALVLLTRRIDGTRIFSWRERSWPSRSGSNTTRWHMHFPWCWRRWYGRTRPTRRRKVALRSYRSERWALRFRAWPFSPTSRHTGRSVNCGSRRSTTTCSIRARRTTAAPSVL